MRKAIPCTVMAFTQSGDRKLVGTLWIITYFLFGVIFDSSFADRVSPDAKD